MKKIMLYGVLLLLLLSCNSNNSKTTIKEITTSPSNEVASKKEMLNPALIEGVLKLLEIKEHLKFPEIPLDSSFIVILFDVDPRGNAVNFSDSTVNIMYNVFTHYNNKNYKGMLKLDSINVVIFDRGNFGEKYYNADSLKLIPLERFKSYPMEVVTIKMYYVENGELKFWCP